MVNAPVVEMVQPLTIVLVTDQFQCQRLIVAGRELSYRTGTPLEVLNIANPKVPQNPEAVEFLFQISKENSATMMVHYSDEPTKFLAGIIKERMPAHVVSGMPHSSDSVLHKLWTRFRLISFFTVDEGGTLAPVTLSSRVIA